MEAIDDVFTSAHWKNRTDKAFFDWIDEQPANWLCTTFTCYSQPFQNNDTLITKLNNWQANQAKIKGTLEEQFGDDDLPDWHDIVREHRAKQSKRVPCSRESLVNGFGKAAKLLDFHYLHKSQRRKGIQILRVPYIGGDIANDIPYHIHCLIELPQGVQLEDFHTHMQNLFQIAMEHELRNIGKFKVKARVWCEPYEKKENAFLIYCGRFEDKALSVGLEKVLFPHLFMNPPLAGAF